MIRVKMGQEKHSAPLPNARSIRRACGNELYRTAKRLKLYVPPDKMEESERLYVSRVIGHLLWISDNRSNRKALADWWEKEVSAEIAELWGVDRTRLTEAFRNAFGG